MEPLSRRPLRHRVAGLLVLVLPRAGAGVGVDRAIRRRNRRSSATPSTSPIASTSVATSGSTRGSRRHVRREAGRWAVSTDAATCSARFLHHGRRVPVDSEEPEVDGIDTFDGETYHTVAGRTRVWTSRPARRGHRHRLVRDPVDPDDRRAGGAAHRVPAHPAYSTPAHNAPLDPVFVAARKASYRSTASRRGRHARRRLDIAERQRRGAYPDERERRSIKGGNRERCSGWRSSSTTS